MAWDMMGGTFAQNLPLARLKSRISACLSASAEVLPGTSLPLGDDSVKLQRQRWGCLDASVNFLSLPE